MKAIILCAGYATRLYPLTKNQSKSLLPVKGKPVIDYILEKINAIPDINEKIIITNNKFYDHFLKWSKDKKDIKIINDMTNSNEDRLGGIGDLYYVIEKENIEEDILVLLGDNLFDFSLNKMIDFFKNKNSAVLGLYDIRYKEGAKNFGVVQIDVDKKIVSIEEKPENPKSSLIVTGIYCFTKEEIHYIKEYMKTNKSKEGPTYLIYDLQKKKEVYGFPFNGKWYDIGSKETYEEVNK